MLNIKKEKSNYNKFNYIHVLFWSFSVDLEIKCMYIVCVIKSYKNKIYIDLLFRSVCDDKGKEKITEYTGGKIYSCTPHTSLN